MTKQPIPNAAAQAIAEQYGYDQVVIVARAVGEDGCEHVTTFGRTVQHCNIAAMIGDFLKQKVMGWPNDIEGVDERYKAFTTALEDILSTLDEERSWIQRMDKIHRIAAAMLLEARGGPKGQR